MTIFGPHKARNRQEVPYLALLSAEFANSVPGVSLFLVDHEMGHVLENSPNLYRLGISWTPFFLQNFCFSVTDRFAYKCWLRVGFGENPPS